MMTEKLTYTLGGACPMVMIARVTGRLTLPSHPARLTRASKTDKIHTVPPSQPSQDPAIPFSQRLKTTEIRSHRNISDRKMYGWYSEGAAVENRLQRTRVGAGRLLLRQTLGLGLQDSCECASHPSQDNLIPRVVI